MAEIKYYTTHQRLPVKLKKSDMALVFEIDKSRAYFLSFWYTGVSVLTGLHKNYFILTYQGVILING